MGGAGVGGHKSGEAVLCDKMLAGYVDRLAKLPRADERLNGISADIKHRRQLLCAVERHGCHLHSGFVTHTYVYASIKQKKYALLLQKTGKTIA